MKSLKVEHPLIRIDNREYLERFQKGELFMRCSLYYNRSDPKDTARTDIYDGAVPADCISEYVHPDIKSMGLKNPRIMMIDTFIKCFFEYQDKNAEKYGVTGIKYSLSDETIDTFKSFKSDSVMIIDKVAFCSQFEQACKAQNLISNYNSAIYLDDDELAKNAIKIVNQEEGAINPAFIKEKKFLNQQEFRIYVKHHINSIGKETTEHSIPYREFANDAHLQTYTIDIGDIFDFAVIVPFDEFIKCDLLLDSYFKVYSFKKRG